MRFMNSYEIDEAMVQWSDHPTLGPAALTLANLRDAADSNSDGWAYWPKPARAAAKLMELIEGDGTSAYRYGDRDDATDAGLRKAYAPIKAFRTRSGLLFDIVEPGAEVDEDEREAEGISIAEVDDLEARAGAWDATSAAIDLGLLREQRDWLLGLDPCDEREGLVNLLDHLLDVGEGYAPQGPKR